METKNIKIADRNVECIEMLDDATCLLTFETLKTEDNQLLKTEAEYWLDEGTYHYNDLYYEEDGNFVDSIPCNTLTEKDKGFVEEFISAWLIENDIENV